MRVALPVRIIPVLRNTFVGGTPARTVVICVAFAAVIALGGHRIWQSGPAPTVRWPGAGVPWRIADPAEPFLQTRIGRLLFVEDTTDWCRRSMFDNRTGHVWDAGRILCFEPPPAEATTVYDRTVALRRSFQK